MFSTPSTAETAKTANVDETMLDTNQQTRPVPWHEGRDWFAVTWLVSDVYNYASTKKSSGAKGGKGGGSSTVATVDVGGLVTCCTEDYLEAIEVDGNIVWSVAGGIARDEAHPEHTGDIVVPDVGTFRFHWGTEDQSGDWLVLNSGGEEHPNYARQSVLEVKTFNCGSSGTPRNVRVLIERSAKFPGLDEERTWEGANPVTGLAEVIGDDFAGLGRPEIIDAETAAALSLRIKNRTRQVAVAGIPDYQARMGYISATIKERQSLATVANSILENFDGWIRRAGEKLEIGCWSHGEISLDGLPELSLHDFVEDPKFANPARDHPDVYTDIIVTGRDRDRNMGDSWQAAGNDAVRDAIGERRVKTVARDHLITLYQLKEQAQELAAFYSKPGKETAVKLRRSKVGGIRPGSRVVINYGPSESRRVFRITKREDTSADSVVTLTITPERALAPLTYIAPVDPAPALPSTPKPGAIAAARIFQLPAAFAGGPAPVVVPLVSRPIQSTSGFRVYFSADDVSYDSLGESIDCAIHGALTAAIGPAGESLTVSLQSFDMALLQEQSPAASLDDTLLLFVGAEILSIAEVTALGAGRYSLSVLRARRGSAGASHAAGDEVWILPRSELLLLDHAAFPRAALTRYFKLQALAIGDEQALSDALKVPFVFADRGVHSAENFTATALAEGALLKWQNPTDPDLLYAEIHVIASGSAAPAEAAQPVATWPVVPGTLSTYSHAGLTAGVAVDIYIRLVDSGAYRSAYTGPAHVTPIKAPQWVEDTLAALDAQAQSLLNSVGDLGTEIRNESASREDADRSISETLSAVSADYNGNKAVVAQQIQALSTQTSAQATSITALSATVGGINTTVTSIAAAYVVDGHATATWGFRLNASGKVIGMQAVAASGGSQAESGVISFEGADLQSSNFATGQSGWRLRPDGSLECNNGWFRGTLHAPVIEFGALILKEDSSAEGGELLFQHGDGTNNWHLDVFSDHRFRFFSDLPGATVLMQSNLAIDGYGYGDFTTYSSRALKTNIRPLEPVLSSILSLQPSRFVWNAQAPAYKVGQEDIGLIAEDVEALFPELVVRDDRNVAAVNYPKLVPLLLRSIQELAAKVDALERRS